MVLTLSYYSINSIEFILVGYLLLIGSIICVLLNKIQKNIKLNYLWIYFNFFNLFENFLNFSFFKKQTLNFQSNFKPSLRFFKKKKWY